MALQWSRVEGLGSKTQDRYVLRIRVISEMDFTW